MSWWPLACLLDTLLWLTMTSTYAPSAASRTQASMLPPSAKR